MRILGIIPVRYHSSRFPGKALADVHGKTMVQRVYEQAKQTVGLDRVVVATDHTTILKHITEFGGKACMTSEDHPSGTDRCREALDLEPDEYDFVVNIQGDEPFIDPRQIEELCKNLLPDIQIATQAKLIEQQENLIDPNCVKVIIDSQGNAIYFSRSPLPFQKNRSINHWLSSYQYYQHIGIYAYRTDILREITKLPVSPLEQAEGLEQLRWLENGYSIKVLTTHYQAHGIDTPEDLRKALAKISTKSQITNSK
ncbi:MAG: 3-deoxy-manno-octulosonate cytidylyltransferase [Bacteroidetes bacterium]|nr:MAG: 3-deoxy-manno-octulosonate cytidylyltransferase [Bacteroidota bacterium]